MARTELLKDLAFEVAVSCQGVALLENAVTIGRGTWQRPERWIENFMTI